MTMKDLSDGAVRIAALCGAASCLLLASAAPARAQRGSAGTRSVDRRIETMNRQGEEYARDKAGRDREGTTESAEERRRAHAANEQVRHDFEGLQAGYNKIVLALSNGARPDDEKITHAVAEVRKFAGRLRDHLSLPQAPEGEARDKTPGASAVAPDAPSAESLQTLCRHIYSFVTNPIFEGPGVLDVKQSARASRDLDAILKLSESLRHGVGEKARPH